MNRREMIKVSLLSGGAVLMSAKSASAQPVRFRTGGFFDPSNKAMNSLRILLLPLMGFCVQRQKLRCS